MKILTPCIWSCITSQYLCIVKDQASRVNIHALWKIMHHESISMLSRRLCIASQYPRIAENYASVVNIRASWKIIDRELISKNREKISFIVEIYELQEDFIPFRNLCIARRYHTSQKNMHPEKILCLIENYAPREGFSRFAKSYASWDDFIPRRNIRVAGRYSYSARSHPLPEKEIVYPNYSSVSTAFL